MAPFTTTATMVDCLNFLLSQISDHDRLAYLTVAKFLQEHYKTESHKKIAT